MGQPHPTGRAALKMLENEGFTWDCYIDIFDGGPTVTARDRPDPDGARGRMAARRRRDNADGGGETMMLASGTLHEFVACYGQVDAHRARRIADRRQGDGDARRRARRPRAGGGALMARWRIVEINFDGIIGPSHNYAGLSLGNLASARNAGECRARARRRCRASTRCAPISALGLVQGLFVPPPRPATRWLAALGTSYRRRRSGASPPMR